MPENTAVTFSADNLVDTFPHVIAQLEQTIGIFKYTENVFVLETMKYEDGMESIRSSQRTKEYRVDFILQRETLVHVIVPPASYILSGIQ